MVGPGLELTISRLADRRSSNWANRAAPVTFVFKALDREEPGLEFG